MVPDSLHSFYGVKKVSSKWGSRILSNDMVI